MLDFPSVRAQHLAQAQARMGALYQHSYVPEQPTAFSAYRLCVKWLAQYAATHPQWTNDLKRVVKKPVVDWIVSQLGVRGVERILIGVFVGVLLDVAVHAFIAWELSGAAVPGQQMLHGSMLDTLKRFAASAEDEFA